MALIVFLKISAVEVNVLWKAEMTLFPVLCMFRRMWITFGRSCQQEFWRVLMSFAIIGPVKAILSVRA